MIGLGILFRMFKKTLGKPLENTGALPTRYYLQEILRSLDNDNIGEAVRLLKMSRGALVDKSRWEMVRQQVIFRCRVLKDVHGKRISLIEKKIKELRKHGKLPWQWLQKKPVEKLAQYEATLDLEKGAQALVAKLEKELKTIDN